MSGRLVSRQVSTTTWRLQAQDPQKNKIKSQSEALTKNDMLELFSSIEFTATVQKAMEKTVKGIVAEQKQHSVAITNNQEEIYHLITMVAAQQTDIDALKGKQNKSQNINFLAPRQKQGHQPNPSKKQGQGHDLTSDPVTPNQNKTTWTNTSTVIVEFNNIWVRKQVYAAKKNLKGSGIYFFIFFYL